jgi:hypothetical protein
MERYRYRTSALVGPWRPRRLAAIQDAVRSRQASADGAGNLLLWLVPGVIERDDEPRPVSGN